MKLAVLALAAGCGSSTVDAQPDAAPLPTCGLKVIGGADASAPIALAADVDGDGLDEILVDAPSGAHLFRGDGRVTQLPNISGKETKIAAGDLDGDGHLDLAMVVGGRIAISHGDGTGAFPVSDPLQGFAVTDLAVADIDGDGKNEIVALSNGKIETYGEHPASFDAGGATWLAVGDLDGDGRPDLLVGNPGDFCVFNCDPTPGTLHMMRNTGGGFGVLVPVPQLDNNSFPTAGWIADLDGDGRNDLVVSALAGLLLPNLGDGAFGAPVQVFPASIPLTIAVGDLDGDGRPEVAMAGGELDIVHGFAAATRYALTPDRMVIGRFSPTGAQLAVLQADNSISLVDPGCLH